MKSRGELFGEKGGGWRETERRPLLFSGDFALFHGLKKRKEKKCQREFRSNGTVSFDVFQKHSFSWCFKF